MNQQTGAKKAMADLAAVAMVVIVCGVIYFIYIFTNAIKQNRLESVYGEISQVCNNMGINANPLYSETPGIHPTIAILQNGQISLEYVPENAQVKSGDIIELVLCIKGREEVLIQRCPYEDNNYVNRYQEKLNVSLHEAASGNIVATAILISEIPEACKSAEQFASSSDGITRSNKTFVSIPQVKDWVAHYSNIGSNGLIKPTQAPTPLSIINPPSTPALLPARLIEGSPSDWLLDSETLPIEFELKMERTVTNDDIINQSTDPTEISNRLNEEGRISGYFKQYIHRDGCKLKSGLFEIQAHTTLYKDSDGAQKAFYWLRSASGVTQTSFSKPDGEYYFFANINSSCNSSVSVRYINMTFRRLNVVSTIFVISIEGTINDEEMLDMATKFIDLIDDKLVATTK